MNLSSFPSLGHDQHYRLTIELDIRITKNIENIYWEKNVGWQYPPIPFVIHFFCKTLLHPSIDDICWLQVDLNPRFDLSPPTPPHNTILQSEMFQSNSYHGLYSFSFSHGNFQNSIYFFHDLMRPSLYFIF